MVKIKVQALDFLATIYRGRDALLPVFNKQLPPIFRLFRSANATLRKMVFKLKYFVRIVVSKSKTHFWLKKITTQRNFCQGL